MEIISIFWPYLAIKTLYLVSKVHFTQMSIRQICRYNNFLKDSCKMANRLDKIIWNKQSLELFIHTLCPQKDFTCMSTRKPKWKFFIIFTLWLFANDIMFWTYLAIKTSYLVSQWKNSLGVLFSHL